MQCLRCHSSYLWAPRLSLQMWQLVLEPLATPSFYLNDKKVTESVWFWLLMLFFVLFQVLFRVEYDTKSLHTLMSNRWDKENLNKLKQNSHTLLKLKSINIFQSDFHWVSSIKNLKVQIPAVLFWHFRPMQTIYHGNAIVHHVFLGWFSFWSISSPALDTDSENEQSISIGRPS